MKVTGNPVICIPHRISLFILLFRMHKNIRFIPVIPFCLTHRNNPVRMARLIFFYQTFHHIQFHLCHLIFNTVTPPGFRIIV